MSYARGRSFQALGQSLMGLGSSLTAQQEREALRVARQAERDEDRRFREMQLRMQPGVEEAPLTRTRTALPVPDLPGLPELPSYGNGDATATALERAAIADMPELDVPDFRRPLTVEEENVLEPGRTRLSDTLAYNPRWREDAAERERERLRSALEGLPHVPELSRQALAAGVPASVALPPPPERDRAPLFGSPEWERGYRTQRSIDAEFRAPTGGGGSLDAQHLIALRQQVNAAQAALERIDRTGPYQGETPHEFQARRQAVLRARGYSDVAELERDAQLVRSAGAGVLGATTSLPEPPRGSVGPTREAARELRQDNLAAGAFGRPFHERGVSSPAVGGPAAEPAAGSAGAFTDEERAEVAELLAAFPDQSPADVLRGVGFSDAEIAALLVY